MFSVTGNEESSHSLLNGKCSFPVKLPQFQNFFTWILCNFIYFFLLFFFLVLGGGDVWDQICVYQIITPSINSVTDYLPKGCQFCFSKQIHILISTSLLNVTSVRMLPKGWSQVFLKFLCIRTSYFMCGDKNETRSWKLAM